MKVKLLKKLREKFAIDYYPSTKQYKCNGERERYYYKKQSAITQMRCNIINYGRKHYREYSKSIRII